MLKKRIIPCLDVKDGRTVKGVQFGQIRDMGDPVELAKIYSDQGADELVFLDISATIEGRVAMLDVIEKVAREINIPFTVGGGINNSEIASEIMNRGADKISINSTAVKNPYLINELASKFGNQCIVLAIDVRKEKDNWIVYTNGGTVSSGHEIMNWIRKGVELGIGEILLTSIDHDGMKEGYAIELLQMVTEEVNVPVIASGGVGCVQHFKEVFDKTKVTGALAASIFHSGELTIPVLKKKLKNENISIRC